MMRIQALSYIVAEATDVSKWKEYGENVLGTATAPAPEGGLYLKLDERAFRITVIPGTENRYFASGWEAVSEQAFRETVTALEKAGAKPVPSTEAQRKARCFRELVSFTDPSGNRHELVWGYTGPTAPFVSPIGVSGFKTGIYGMGHTVLPATNFDATLDFFRNVFGFGLSDVFNFQPAPDAPRMRIYFLHAASGRHHSLALAEMPASSGCVHMMLEVNSMTEVGLAHDRLQKKGVKLMATLGQHENDHMTSFYMLTPGNFAVEYGWGGLIVDPATHKTTETQRVSIWGHDFSVGFR